MTNNLISKTATSAQQAISTVAARAIVFTVVVAAHLAALTVWSKQPYTYAANTHELSLSLAVAAQASPPAIPQPRQAAPAIVPMPAPAEEPHPSATAAQAVAATAPSVAPAAPAIADTEPDYRASYLNNTPPFYPMVARRNGLQGRVILNVEVLADGMCGKINIHKSSGYAMLDNAALQTVRNWRFMPARQAGHAVDKWFMIPVQFSLKDNAA